MKDNENVERILYVIEASLKNCSFTFENLRIESLRNNRGEHEVTVKFTFNECGNNNKSLV